MKRWLWMLFVGVLSGCMLVIDPDLFLDGTAQIDPLPEEELFLLMNDEQPFSGNGSLQRGKDYESQY